MPADFRVQTYSHRFEDFNLDRLADDLSSMDDQWELVSTNTGGPVDANVKTTDDTGELVPALPVYVTMLIFRRRPE